MNYMTITKENSINIDLYCRNHVTGEPVVWIHDRLPSAAAESH
jgi:hypothetical protein